MPFLSLRLPLVRSESINAFVVAPGLCRSSCRFCACNMVYLFFKVQVVIADYESIIVFCGFLRNTAVRTVLYRYSAYLREIYNNGTGPSNLGRGRFRISIIFCCIVFLYF